MNRFYIEARDDLPTAKSTPIRSRRWQNRRRGPPQDSTYDHNRPPFLATDPMSVLAEVRVPGSAFHLSPLLLEFPDVRVEFTRLGSVDEGVTYVWVDGGDTATFVDALRDVPDVRVVDELQGQTLLRFDSPQLEASLTDLIADHGARLVSLSGDAEGWMVCLQFADTDGIDAFVSDCQDRSIPVDLRQVYDADDRVDLRKIYDVHGRIDGDFGLTPAQQEALDLAFAAGYFDVPRQVTLTDLAERLQVSEQAVSERIRRGLASLLTTTMLDDRSEAEEP